MAGGTDGNSLSVGGMGAKVKAAELVTRSGESLWIAGGWDFAVLERILAGEDVGTLFVADASGRMAKHKRYLAFFSKPGGDIVVDAGAARALRQHGRSLLPSGVSGVTGTFSRGDTVRIVDAAGGEIARGVTNYSSTEVECIRGRRTSELQQALGYEAAAYDEVVHRNYLVLTGAWAESELGSDDKQKAAP
jgi:glutamate 5-kinase